MSSLLAGLRFGPPPDYTWEPVVTPGCDNRPPMAPMEVTMILVPTSILSPRGNSLCIVFVFGILFNKVFAIALVFLPLSGHVHAAC